MEKNAFDPARFKAQERAGFNLVADRYEAAMSVIDPAIQRMIQLAQLEAGQRLLDVATGPGVVARAIADKVGPELEIVGVDIAETALEVARQQAKAAGHTGLTFQVEDAEQLSFAADTFDRIICSMGLMHFPNPEQALLEMYRVLKPGGRLVAAVWGEGHEVPFIQVALTTLARNFPPPKVERPSMFRFGNPYVLTELLEEAGLAEVQTEAVIVPVSASSPADYWQRFLGAAGITAVALAKQPPEMLTRLETDSQQDLQPYYHHDDGSYDLASSVRLVTGVKKLTR